MLTGMAAGVRNEAAAATVTVINNGRADTSLSVGSRGAMSFGPSPGLRGR